MPKGDNAGRPRDWHEEDATFLIEYMEGNDATLSEAAQARGMPLTSAHRTLKTYPQHWARYRELQESHAAMHEAGALAILTATHEKILTLPADDKRVNALANSARNISEALRWRARVADPERYGERVNVNASVTTRSVVLLPPLASASIAPATGQGTLTDAGARGALPAPAIASDATDVEYHVSDASDGSA